MQECYCAFFNLWYLLCGCNFFVKKKITSIKKPTNWPALHLFFNTGNYSVPLISSAACPVPPGVYVSVNFIAGGMLEVGKQKLT